jgi:hypothetical protein
MKMGIREDYRNRHPDWVGRLWVGACLDNELLDSGLGEYVEKVNEQGRQLRLVMGSSVNWIPWLKSKHPGVNEL